MLSTTSSTHRETKIDLKWTKWIVEWQHLTWQTAPWFVVETFAYRLLLQAVSKNLLDPFQATKRAALKAAKPTWTADLATLAQKCAQFAPSTGSATQQELTHLLLHRSLWGNRADLSLSGGTVAEEQLSHVHKSDEAYASTAGTVDRGLLCDDSAAAVAWLSAACAAEAEAGSDSAPSADATTAPQDQPRGVMLFADNAGLEILSDLLLVAWLLVSGCPLVTLALKPSPILVSDATPADLEDTLQWLEEIATSADASASSAGWLAGKLRGAVTSGRLVVTIPHWTVSPLPAWSMDEELQGVVNSHAVVIFKGDANYRRLLGDRHVPFDLPAADALSYLPRRTIALRTAKSGVMCGVSARTCVQAAVALQPDAAPALEAALQASGGVWGAALHAELLRWDKWLVTGHFGQIQVADSSTTST